MFRLTESEIARMVERLQPTPAPQSNDFSSGVSAGRKWAVESAQASGMKRLADLKREHGSNFESFFRNPLSDLHARVGLYLAIFPEKRDDSSARSKQWMAEALKKGEGHSLSEKKLLGYEAFWKGICGDDASASDSEDWLRGFAEGAIEAWGQIHERILQ